MGKKKYLSGEVVWGGEPNWQPLQLAGADWVLSAFMAMHQIRLETGVTICAYKHSDTRRYVHLDERGRAYEYVCDGRHDGKYKQVQPWEAFDRCIRDPDFMNGFDTSSRLHAPIEVRDDEDDWEPTWDPERGWPLSYFSRGRGGPLVPTDLWPEPARPPG